MAKKVEPISLGILPLQILVNDGNWTQTAKWHCTELISKANKDNEVETTIHFKLGDDGIFGRMTMVLNAPLDWDFKPGKTVIFGVRNDG